MERSREILSIREEEAADVEAIRQVEQAAFGQAAEAALVDRLRADGDLLLSLVAVDNRALVGHLALSRMEAPFRALGLGPVAVLPELQQSGIGSALIRHAIAWAREAGLDAIFVLGEPSYYRRFGFDAEAAEPFASTYAGPYLMVLPLDTALPGVVGPIEYARAFKALP